MVTSLPLEFLVDKMQRAELKPSFVMLAYQAKVGYLKHYLNNIIAEKVEINYKTKITKLAAVILAA